MKHKNKLLKNSSIALLSQVITTIFTFATRNLFINYIGIETLGINGTFSSILGTFSLAELGIQTAITYSLFKPLHDNNYEEINNIMNIFEKLYKYIGLFFVAASLLTLPFLKFILTGIQISISIYLYFLLQASSTTATYFLSYRRSLLYADQKDYIAKTVDLFSMLIFNIIQCVSIIMFKNYCFFLIIKTTQVITSNFVISRYCKRNYTYLKQGSINKSVLKRILFDIKNVFSGRIASYVYGSTDNLIISMFVSTVSVGYITNYTTITKNLRSIIQSALLPVLPFVGNYLADKPNITKKKELFQIYSHIRYIIAVMVVVPVLVLCNDFIRLWIGENMIMNSTIIYLICIDFYIDIVHSSTMDFIYGSGLFHIEKRIEIIGASINLLSSIILVNIFGIEGVLVGTIISQLFFWIGRSSVVFYKCLNSNNDTYIKYWTVNLLYIIVFITSYIICKNIYSMLKLGGISKFLVGGFIIEIIIIVLILLVFNKKTEQRQIIKYIFEFNTK